MILIMTSIASAELVAHWRLDDGTGTVAVDSSGNGHDGTLLLDPQWVAGKYDGALEFGGISGQRVEIEGYDGVLGTQNRTVMAWVKSAGLGDWISYGQNVTSQKWIGRINDNANNGAVGALRTECSGGYIISTTVLTDDEWHHLVSILESDGAPTIFDISMYVDGTLVRRQVTFYELSYSPGTHVIELRHPDFDPHSREVQITSGETQRFQHTFSN